MCIFSKTLRKDGALFVGVWKVSLVSTNVTKFKSSIHLFLNLFGRIVGCNTTLRSLGWAHRTPFPFCDIWKKGVRITFLSFFCFKKETKGTLFQGRTFFSSKILAWIFEGGLMCKHWPVWVANVWDAVLEPSCLMLITSLAHPPVPPVLRIGSPLWNRCGFTLMMEYQARSE